MKPRRLIALAAATGFSVVVAIATIMMSREAVKPAFRPAPLFPALTGQLNDAREISIVTGQSSLTMLRQADGRWVLSESYDYPVKPDMVRKTLLGLADLELAAPRSARPAAQKALGLAEPGEAGGGILYRVLGPDGKELAAAIIGKVQDIATEDRPATLYVRRPGETQTWLARGRFSADAERLQWIDSQILPLSRERITEVEAAPFGFKPYRLVRRPEEMDFRLDPMPAGKELTAISAPNTVGGGLAFLTLEDVRPADRIDMAGGSVIRYRTADGLIATLSLKPQDGAMWARLDVGANPGAAEAVKTEAAQLQARVAGWAFQIPKALGEDLTAPAEKLFKDGKPVSEAPKARR